MKTSTRLTISTILCALCALFGLYGAAEYTGGIQALGIGMAVMGILGSIIFGSLAIIS